jgi:hypothetical protein
MGKIAILSVKSFFNRSNINYHQETLRARKSTKTRATSPGKPVRVFVGLRKSSLVGRAGFEPAKALSQQIYSLPRLATSVPTQDHHCYWRQHAPLYGRRAGLSNRERCAPFLAAARML